MIKSYVSWVKGFGASGDEKKFSLQKKFPASWFSTLIWVGSTNSQEHYKR